MLDQIINNFLLDPLDFNNQKNIINGFFRYERYEEVFDLLNNPSIDKNLKIKSLYFLEKIIPRDEFNKQLEALTDHPFAKTSWDREISLKDFFKKSLPKSEDPYLSLYQIQEEHPDTRFFLVELPWHSTYYGPYMREKVSLISEVYLLDREKTAFIASANRSMFLDPLYPKIEVLESEESEELVEEVEQDILPTLEGGYFGSGITVLNYYPIDDSEYDDLDSEELYDQIREDFSSNIEL